MKRFAVLIGVALFVGCSAANEPEAGKKDPHGAGQHGDHAGGASGAMLMVQTIPKALKAGEAGSLNLMVHDADGTMVREFDVNHDKLANLIIVRDGLDEFAHIHPEVDGQGNMTATHAFPKAGKDRLFVDYKPKGKSAATATAVVEVIGEATVVVTAIAPIAQDYEPARSVSRRERTLKRGCTYQHRMQHPIPGLACQRNSSAAVRPERGFCPSNRSPLAMTSKEVPVSAAMAAQSDAYPAKVKRTNTHLTAIDAKMFCRMIVNVRLEC